MAKNLGIIIQDFFYFCFSALLLAIILEIFFSKIILVYFNINYLVALVFISGFVLLIKK